MYIPAPLGQWQGDYTATWVVVPDGIPSPQFTENILDNGIHVVEISGGLQGSWTPYKYRSDGSRYLDKKHTLYKVPGWFEDHQVASSAELTREHMLGCGALQVILREIH